MEVGAWVGAGLSISALLAWLWLALLRGRFWATCQRLNTEDISREQTWPRVVAVIPARDEARFIRETIRSVLGQNYAGSLKVYLVDDRSSDGTADAARAAAREVQDCPPFRVVTANERPEGWAGKVWALHRAWKRRRGRSTRISGSPTPTSCTHQTC